MTRLSSVEELADAISDAVESRGGAAVDGPSVAVPSVAVPAADVPGAAASSPGVPARFVVGLAGSPGAGKSTVGAELVRRLGPTAQLLAMDGFHLPQARLVELGRRERMGAPDTFDVDGFVATLVSLRAGGEVRAPGFDRSVEEPTPGSVPVPASARIVVVEGNYLLLDAGGWQRVAPLLDLSVFVAVDRDIRIARLVARHEEFGKSPAAARAWALGPDEQNARMIEPTAARADHILRLPTR